MYLLFLRSILSKELSKGSKYLPKYEDHLSLEKGKSKRPLLRTLVYRYLVSSVLLVERFL